jgi:hypothetical protein
LAAQDQPPGALPADLALVPPDAMAFVHVRVAEVWNGPVGQKLRQQWAKELAVAQPMITQLAGVAPDEVERATAIFPSPSDNPLVIVMTRKPIDRTKLLAAALPEPREHQHKGKTYYTSAKAGRTSIHFATDHVFVIGQVEDVVHFLGRLGERKADGPLGDALRLAAGKHHAVVGFRVPEELAVRAKEEIGREIERAREPLPTAAALTVRPLLEVRSGVLTVDLADTTTLGLHLVFPNEAQARDALWPAQDALALARILLRPIAHHLGKEEDFKSLVNLTRTLEAALRTAAVEQRGATLRVSVQVKIDAATLADTGQALVQAIAKVRANARQTQLANNLRQIAIAMHNYHGDFGTLPPPALTSKDGKPLLSWRVAILPYIEQDQLYRQFRLDEPWDSPHNKALLKHMPAVYRPLNVDPKAPHVTHFRVFVGGGAIFDPKAGTRLQDIKDGTSNTILVVEAGEAVPWTKPDELPYDAKQPLPKLGGQFPAGFYAVFADGSVRFLKKTVPESALRALITHDGGEVIDLGDQH